MQSHCFFVTLTWAKSPCRVAGASSHAQATPEVLVLRALQGCLRPLRLPQPRKELLAQQSFSRTFCPPRLVLGTGHTQLHVDVAKLRRLPDGELPPVLERIQACILLHQGRAARLRSGFSAPGLHCSQWWQEFWAPCEALICAVGSEGLLFSSTVQQKCIRLSLYSSFA